MPQAPAVQVAEPLVGAVQALPHVPQWAGLVCVLTHWPPQRACGATQGLCRGPSGGPTSGGPTSGGPTSGGPTSGGPASTGTTPVSGGPVSAGPASIATTPGVHRAAVDHHRARIDTHVHRAAVGRAQVGRRNPRVGRARVHRGGARIDRAQVGHPDIAATVPNLIVYCPATSDSVECAQTHREPTRLHGYPFVQTLRSGRRARCPSEAPGPTGGSDCRAPAATRLTPRPLRRPQQ
jgi:hypothetical protein